MQADEARELAERIVMAMYFPHGVRNMEENAHAQEQAEMVKELLSESFARVRLEEAKWWDGTWGAKRRAKVRANRLIELERAAIRSLAERASKGAGGSE